jgi:hypothetical protein
VAGIVPTVMISSTVFDLTDVRSRLAHFIEEELGYRALVSESGQFPVDPELNTVDLCRRRVEEDVDILVLIVGTRYGSVDDRYGKSITNIEYLAARNKRIPVYVFMSEDLVTALEHLPEGGASLDTRLISFARALRNSDGVWVFTFENVDEIVSCLRVQLAYFVTSGLRLYRRLITSGDPLLEKLPPKAMELVIYTPIGWEYQLFGEVLRYEAESRLELRDRYDLKLTAGPTVSLEIEALPRWLNAKMQHALGLVRDLGVLMNERLQEALGPQGVPGDARGIALVARHCGYVYEEALRWVLDMRRMALDDDLQAALGYVERGLSDVILQLGTFGAKLSTDVVELREWSKKNPGERVERRFTLNITADDSSLTEGWELIQKAMRRRGYSI